LAVPATAQADDFTVTNLNNSGNGSLRDAVDDSNLNAGADRILFSSSLTGTIELTSGELNVTQPLEVVGPGAQRLTVSGSDDSRIFTFGPGPSTISGLTITDGSDVSGGAVRNDGTLTVSRSIITGNEAVDNGGALYAYPGDLRVEDSTISDNQADTGGAIYAYGDAVEIVNTTISGNTGISSGAVAVASDIGGGSLTVLSSTVTDNDSGDDGGGILSSNGLISVDLTGSIIAGNRAIDNGDDLSGLGFDTAAFNLIGDPGNSGISSGGGNIIGADPKLAPLRNNGGPTETHALGEGSPAKNAGPTSGAPAADQRGAPRKGRADIGAYELVKCKGVEVDVVGTSGKDRLRGDGGANGILGLGGNDRLAGLQNRDGLCGAGGKDKLIGGSGRDKLLGGPGKDLLKGGKAADKLNGGPGNDRCIGGSGPGNDKLKSC
jgi:Ca2+-binding RTX toxin-like protein